MEKFLHIHLLISVILSIVLVVLGNGKSFSPLNASYIMEARKRFMSFDMTKLVHPPMPSYTFSIYNRGLFEKSKFKEYDSLLESKLARSQARAKRWASILKNGNANGTHASKRDRDPISTSTHFVDGEYVAAFMLGTGQNDARHLLVDTGSDFVWWQCGPCSPNKCYEQRNEPLYYFTQSRTYRKIDCRAEPKNCILKPNVIQCTSFANTCEYDYRYEDGSRSRGWVGKEKITFLSDHSQVRILFGCGKDQTSGTPFHGDFSGIAGLGPRIRRGGYSLASQFKANVMALCLPDFYSTNPSTLTFHATPFRKETEARLLLNPSLPVYFVNLYKLFVNDKEIPLFPSLSRIGNDLSEGCIVDTGTVITSFPRDIYTVFRDTFRHEAQYYHLRDPPQGSYFDTCYAVDEGVSPSFPAVRMFFGRHDSEYELLLMQHRVVIYERELWCLAFVPWDHNIAIIGSYQLQGVGLTFDTKEKALYFELDACR